MTTSPLREAITLAGEQAFRDGLTIKHNPYLHGQQEHIWWHHGWLVGIFTKNDNIKPSVNINAQEIIANQIKAFREHLFGKSLLDRPLPSEEAMAAGIVAGLRNKGYEITQRGVSGPSQPS